MKFLNMFAGIGFTASLSFVCEGKSRVPIYAWIYISKKFHEEECTLSFAKWQIPLCVLELQGGKYKFVLHSRLVTPNPSDLRGRDVWGCSDKLPSVLLVFHINIFAGFCRATVSGKTYCYL